MKLHYASAFGAELLTQSCILATFYVIGTAISPAAILEYALVRRVFSLVFPLCIIGFDTGLARYGWEYRHETKKLIITVFRFSLPAFIAIAILFLIFSNQSAVLLFGSAEYEHYVVPLLTLTLGSIFHACAYNLYRGLLRTHTANIILILNHGIAPLAFAFITNSINELLLMLGIFWIFSSSCFLIPYVRTRHRNEITVRDTGAITSFSLKRFPADILGIAFFSLPVILAAHIWNATTAGQLAIGLSLISMAGSAFSPFNVVFLPHLSRRMHERTAGTMIRKVLPFAGIFFAMLTVAIVLGEIALEPIVTVIFHSSDLVFISLLRVLLIGVFPFCIYSIAKSLIDTYQDGSRNSRNMAFALVFLIIQFTAGWIMRMPANSIAIAIVSSLIVLSLMSLRDARNSIRNHAI